jgi:glyoxylase-like metal-dependent hydrolase (beta-lactamase superfamily II)
MALGDVVELDRRTVLVLGQELISSQGQPDVANSLLHVAGDTLYLVDTGCTEQFREALVAAVGQLGSWSRLVVLTTHGHVDHVGNNDLADQLGHDHGASVVHLVPAADVAQMRDAVGYWTDSLRRLAGVLPGYESAGDIASLIVSLFQPQHPFGATTRTFEASPFERIDIGPLRLTGWSFGDGAVNVLRSQGHCAGQVVVHLRDAGVLHLSDEANAPCGAMHDADQVKLLTSLGHAATLVESGAVRTVTEGHLFRASTGDDAVARMETLLDQAVELDARAHDLLGDGTGPVDAGAFAGDLGDAYAVLGTEGGNPSPMFLALMAVNTLRELGLAPVDGGDGGRWAPPELR